MITQLRSVERLLATLERFIRVSLMAALVSKRNVVALFCAVLKLQTKIFDLYGQRWPLHFIRHLR